MGRVPGSGAQPREDLGAEPGDAGQVAGRVASAFAMSSSRRAPVVATRFAACCAISVAGGPGATP